MESVYSWEQPRTRGENSASLPNGRLTCGSTPHTRGKGANTSTTTDAPGINPACAGKSRTLAASGRARSEQPRMRGEKGRERSPPPYLDGTTPRARGKEFLPVRRPRGGGNNPAYAGKSGPVTPALHRARNQPRIRGEKRGLAQHVHGLQGSTPHARGKVFVTCWFVISLFSSRVTCSHHDTAPTDQGTTCDTDTSPVLT